MPVLMGHWHYLHRDQQSLFSLQHLLLHEGWVVRKFISMCPLHFSCSSKLQTSNHAESQLVHMGLQRHHPSSAQCQLCTGSSCISVLAVHGHTGVLPCEPSTPSPAFHGNSSLEGIILQEGLSSQDPSESEGQTPTVQVTMGQPHRLVHTVRGVGSCTTSLSKGFLGVAGISSPWLRAKTTANWFHTVTSATRNPKTELQRSKVRPHLSQHLPVVHQIPMKHTLELAERHETRTTQQILTRPPQQMPPVKVTTAWGHSEASSCS